MSYYAEQSPRGFANETSTFKFSTKSNRDAWVAEHANDGDVNSAACGASAITRKQAERNVGYKGDSATESYNSDLIDGDYEISRKDGDESMYRYTSF